MKKSIEKEAKLYLLMSIGAMFAEFTMILGFFIAFIALLFWAGII